MPAGAAGAFLPSQQSYGNDVTQRWNAGTSPCPSQCTHRRRWHWEQRDPTDELILGRGSFSSLGSNLVQRMLLPTSVPCGRGSTQAASFQFFQLSPHAHPISTFFFPSIVWHKLVCRNHKTGHPCSPCREHKFSDLLYQTVKHISHFLLVSPMEGSARIYEITH